MRLTGVGVLLIASLANGCSSQPAVSDGPASDKGSRAEKVIGTAGGQVSTAEGGASVTIPPGALSADVKITIAPAVAPPAGCIGQPFEIGPTGTTFAQPVTIILSYRQAHLGGASPTALRVATYQGSAWAPLEGMALDTVDQTVSGRTTHLSPYGLLLPSSPDAGQDVVKPDAGQDVVKPDAALKPDMAVAQCGPATCAGCCSGSICLPGTDNASCGVKGGACVACSGGQICQAGACTPGPSCPGGCLIAGTCHQPGEKDATGCGICDPAKSTTTWSTVTNTCQIGGQCFAAGAKDPTGCGVCDPAVSTTTWTPAVICPSGQQCVNGACQKATDAGGGPG